MRLSGEIENKAHYEVHLDLLEVNINFEKERKRKKTCPITFEHRQISVKSICFSIFGPIEFKILEHLGTDEKPFT